MASEGLPRFVFVMAFTGSHIDEARNVLSSLDKVRNESVPALPPAELHVYTRTERVSLLHVYPSLLSFDLGEYLTDVNTETAEANWGTTGFSRIVMGKFHALLRTLEIAPDAHVVWLDTDLFFFKDPRVELLKHSTTFPKAIAHFQRSCGKTNACTGFFHLPPEHRDAQRELLTQAMTRLRRHNTAKSPSTYKGDEACINEELATGKYNFSFLLRSVFPNGQDFFNHKSHDRTKVILVHNNFIKGLSAKIQRFKAHGFWLVD